MSRRRASAPPGRKPAELPPEFRGRYGRMLSGDRDGGLPLEGIEILEKKLGKFDRPLDKSDAFRSTVYPQTGHEYLPEMKDELIRWLDRHLAGKR